MRIRKVKDAVTGFTGIVTSYTEYLNKCVRVGVTSQELKDGKPIDAHVFDEEQLIIVKAAAVKIDKPKPTGGPQDSKWLLEQTHTDDKTRIFTSIQSSFI
jgi:hypothetical protein